MKKCFISFVIAVSLMVTSVYAETIRVTGNNVNLRAAPVDDAEVVSQVMEGDLIESVSKDDKWFKIVPPQKVSLWVYGELVRDGVVAVSKLKVRGGQGINYKSVGLLKKGDKVQVRGKVGDWLKIAPPKGSYLWVSVDYAEKVKKKTKPLPPVNPAKKTAAKSPVKPAKRPVAKKPLVKKPPMPEGKLPGQVHSPVAIKEPIPAPPAGPAQEFISKDRISEDMLKVIKRLRPTEGKGRLVQYKGVLRKSSLVWHRPSKYRLIMSDNKGRSYTICYVLGDDKKLRDHVGKLLLVYGREYWVDGVRYSVVIPRQVVPKD